MSTIATLAVKLIGDVSGFTASMTEAERKAQESASNIGKTLQNVGQELTNVGKMATVGLTVPLVTAGLGAVKMASDLEETKNKVMVVFGDMSDAVMEWSNNSATAMGMSQQQALEAAGTFGNLFLTLGAGKQDAADMSTSLIQLASDLASFNNANPEDVLLALRSGLIGEAEPLRKFGVNLSEAAVKAKAMAMGLAESEDELTDAAKLQARYALILEQTTTAQGDFARTADGLANSTRTLKAQFADAGAQLGQQLLPYALQFVEWASDMISKFQALTPEQQRWILILAGVAAAIGPVLVVVGSLVTAIGAIIPVVGAVAAALSGVALPILAVIAVVALLYLAWTNNWGGIQEKTQAVITFIQGLIAAGMQFINDLTSGRLGALSQIWNNILSSISTFINTWVANIKLIFQAFQAAMNGDWYRFGELMRQVFNNALNAILTIVRNAWNNIKLAFSTAITSIRTLFTTTNWGAVGKAIVDGIAKGISNGAKVIADAAMKAAKAALAAVKGFLGIHSPSTVFQQQVGFQMAAGTAAGWELGLDKLLAPSLPQMVPATVPAVAGMGGGGGAGMSAGGLGGFGSMEMLGVLQDIRDKDFDYDKLARKLRDAVLMRSG